MTIFCKIILLTICLSLLFNFFEYLLLLIFYTLIKNYIHSNMVYFRKLYYSQMHPSHLINFFETFYFIFLQINKTFPSKKDFLSLIEIWYILEKYVINQMYILIFFLFISFNLFKISLIFLYIINTFYLKFKCVIFQKIIQLDVYPYHLIHNFNHFTLIKIYI